MIEVQYTVRGDDRLGYLEDHVRRFDSMPEVYDFIKRVMLHRRVDGKLVIGTPLVEDVNK
jgi:hypothetical protein